MHVVKDELKQKISAQGQSSKKFAYVGCRTTKERNARGKGINVYQVDAKTEKWTFIQLMNELDNPSFLTFDYNQNFLFTVHGDYSEVSSFKIDRGTGKLTFLNRQSTGGNNPVHLIVDKSNQFLIVANLTNGTLAVLPINQDGSLEPLVDLASTPDHSGEIRTDSQALQGVSHPHQVLFDLSGQYLIVPDLGLDKLFIFTFDSDIGKLYPANHAYELTDEGSGPRHATFHPEKPFLFVANQLSSTISTYHFENGKLQFIHETSTLPDTFILESNEEIEVKASVGMYQIKSRKRNNVAGIVAEQSGRYIYVSNRGHNSVAIFKVNDNGTLTTIGWEPTRGETPRFLTIDPSGRYLYVANEDSDSIVTFEINRNTGELELILPMINTESPVCIILSSGDS